MKCYYFRCCKPIIELIKVSCDMLFEFLVKSLYDLMERATSGLIYVNQADLGFEVTSRVTRDTLYDTLNSTTNDNIILKILIK